MTHISHAWLESYPDTVAWDQTIATRPVFTFLADTARDYPTHRGFDFLGKKYTWQHLHDHASRLAKGLQDHGIKKGDKIGLLLPNTPYYLIAYNAILMSGATIVNLNPLYAETELQHLIEDSELDTVITLDLSLTYDKMHKLLRGTRLNHIIVCKLADALPFPKNILAPLLKPKDFAKIAPHKRLSWYSDMIDNDGSYASPDINPQRDIAVLQYTGGTTGVPKGAMLTHTNIYTNTIQAQMWFHGIKKGQDKMLAVLPFFHVFAMTAVMNFSVVNALEIIALPRFDLKQALQIIQKKKPTLFPAVPAIYSAINASPLQHKYDLSSLKYCLSGGAPLPVEVKRVFEDKTGCTVIEGYGLTECSPVACANVIAGRYKDGSIGLPFPATEIEIINPDDKTTKIPNGERGELCIIGAQVMAGYWKNEDATADVLRQTEDGRTRLHTGDIAIMDDEGYVFIVDRLKDMIITNGYNVYPRNVEEAIYKHPSVEECIVAGLPDANRGEIVKAWIKVHDDRTLTADDLKTFLKDHLSPMEIPKRIEFRREPLPKTMIGKLSRKDVIAEEKKT